MNLKRWIAMLLVAALLATAAPALAAPSYYVTVDLTNQIVTVYQAGNVSKSGIVRQMICSTGKSGSSTPAGTFTLPKKSRSSERSEWYYFSEYRCYAKWATRIRGGILFHSVTYSTKKSGPSASAVRNLGSPASHGCIRLRVEDAKWIAYNCPAGTKVKIYYSGQRDSALRSRLLKKTFSASNQTYGEFTGTSGVLAKGSSGEKVRQLQNRLIELGYLRSAADGVGGNDTHNAVAAFQQNLGVTANGKVDAALWDRLFAADTPAAGLVQGDSGEKVVRLQKALKGLRLYSGAENGSFDAATAAAVREYQTMNGQSATGSVSDALLSAMEKRADELKKQFGDSDYRLVESTVSVNRAKVKVSSSLNLRQKASTSSKILARMKNGAVVTVLEKGGKWSRVQYGSAVGYVMNSYLRCYTDTTSSRIYEAVLEPTSTPEPTATVEPTPTPEATATSEATATAEPAVTPTPEPTAQTTTLKWGGSGEGVANLQRALKALKLYNGEASGSFDEATVDAVKLFQRVTGQSENGEATPALQTAIFEKVKAVRGEFGDKDYNAVISTVSNTRAKVKVRSSLNLRQKASTSSKSLARMKNGTDVAVLERGSKWSKIQYGSKIGYVMNSYLRLYTQSSSSLSYEEAPATPAPTATAVPTETPAPTETPVPTETAAPAETPAPTATIEPEPTAQATTLKWGSRGEGVTNLQRALKALKLFDGEINGSFGETTVDAVNLFQRVTGQSETGEAAPALQTAIFEKAKAVRGEFGDRDYNAVISTVSNARAKVKVSSSLNLRQKASTSSKSLAKMKNGTDVAVLERGSKWSKIQYGSKTGYAMNSYLTFYTQSSASLNYEAVEVRTLEAEIGAVLAAVAEPMETEEPMPVLPPEETVQPEATAEPSQKPAQTEEPMPVLPPEEPLEPEVTAEPSKEPAQTEQPMPVLPPESPAETVEPTESAAPVETVQPEKPAQTAAPEEPAEMPAPTATVLPKPLYAIVKKDDAALRSEKELSEKYVVRPLVRGEFFEVVETDEEWTTVREEDSVYYIRTEEIELTEIKPEPTPRPTEAPRETEAPHVTEAPAPTIAAEPTETPEPAETPAPQEESNEEQPEEKAE